MNIKQTIVKLLSRKKKNKGEFKPETFKKILVVRPEKIGDTVCMLPFLRELKKSFPAASIDVYASTYNNFMFKYVKYIDNVYTEYRTKGLLKTYLDVFKMRANQYDLIIDTVEIKLGKIFRLYLINAPWLIANSGDTRRYGLINADLKHYYKLTQWKKIHTTERLLEFLDLLGIHNYDSTMELPIGEDSVGYARNFLQLYQNRQLIGFNADASDQARSLQDDDIVAICRQLIQSNDQLTLLLFCSKDRQSDMKNLIKKHELKNVIYESGSKNIFDAAALVRSMHVLISPDTSFIHIASAYNIPTVGIYKNDDDHLRYWGPRSSQYRIIKPATPGNSIQGFSIEETVSATLALL